METMILKGKPVADKVKDALKVKLCNVDDNHNKLAIMRIGNSPSDLSYEKGIKKNAEEVCLDSEVHTFEEDVTEEEFISKLKELNEDERVTGILIFRPLPERFNTDKIFSLIDEEKDVDCINPINLGKVFKGNGRIPPCTPMAAIKLLEFYNIPVSGKKIAIVNRSYVVGRPLALMLLERDATVSVCHSKTDEKDLIEICKAADIVVTATGIAKKFDERFFKEDTVIIDIGMSPDENGKLSGDVDFDRVNGKVKAITPVMGGIGAITSSILIQNAIKHL